MVCGCFFVPKKKGDKGMKLVLAEKPSVAQGISKILGANERCDDDLPIWNHQKNMMLGFPEFVAAGERFSILFLFH